ncbi:MAG: response regulator [Myxococcales bacterium]
MATVLVVDDNEDVREVLAQILESDGYDVVTAADGLEALQEVARQQVCVIVLDLSMPRLDGFGFLTRLRGGADQPNAPVVVVSSVEEPNVPLANHVLRKPVDVEELMNLVERYCSARMRGRA